MRSDKVFKWFLGIVSLLVFSPLFYLLTHQLHTVSMLLFFSDKVYLKGSEPSL